MAEPTVAGFRIAYPEFTVDPYTDEIVQYNLELAMEVHRCSTNAIYALTAHLLSLATSEGTGGLGDGSSVGTSTVQTIKKARVGRITTEFVTASSDSDDGYYEQTPYGKKFVMLRDAAQRKFRTRVR